MDYREETSEVILRLHGGEALQEDFDKLIEITHAKKGWSLVASPPRVGSTSRVQLAIDKLSRRREYEENHEDVGDSVSTSSFLSQWKSVLLKYNDKIERTEAESKAKGSSHSKLSNFNALYLDLRGLSYRNEILAGVASQLLLDSAPTLQSLYRELLHYLETDQKCTVVVLDHVNKTACPNVFSLFKDVAASIGIIVMAEISIDPYETIVDSSGKRLEVLPETSCADIFITEILGFTSILNISWSVATDKESERVLVYSSTLSSKAAQTLAASLIGLDPVYIKGDDTINTAEGSSSFFMESKSPVDDLPLNSLATKGGDARITDKTAKLQIVLDLAKGIPGLIAQLSSLDTSILQKLFTTLKRQPLKTSKVSTNKYNNAGRIYITVTKIFFAIFSDEFALVDKLKMYDVICLTIPVAVYVPNSPIAEVGSLLGQKLLSVRGMDANFNELLNQLGILVALPYSEVCYISGHTLNIAINAISITDEQRRTVASSSFDQLWSIICDVGCTLSLLNLLESIEDLGSLDTIASQYSRLDSDIEWYIPKLNCVIQVLFRFSMNGLISSGISSKKESSFFDERYTLKQLFTDATLPIDVALSIIALNGSIFKRWGSTREQNYFVSVIESVSLEQLMLFSHQLRSSSP